MKHKPLTSKLLNTIRGRVSVGHATNSDVSQLLEHIDALEAFLDDNQEDDQFGTEGWRHAIGIED